MQTECHYCEKPCKKEAFVPETGMTIDFPFCNNKCLKFFRLERGYDKPKTKKQKEFVLKLLKKEKADCIKDINRKIKELNLKQER